MKKTILFVHGMFLNKNCWGEWENYFEKEGFECLSISWPLHEGSPDNLRKNMPEELGDLRLQTIINKFIDTIERLPSKPIIIGHSVGGLITQVLLNRGLGEMGVCICSVPPKGVLTMDEYAKLENAGMILDPLKGNEPFIMTPEGFHATFGNTLTEEQSNKEYKEFATNDSRNVLRDTLNEVIALDMPHKPMLFISATEDQIILPFVNQKNVKAYTDQKSVTAIKEFTNRGHYICGEPQWEQVAEYVNTWIKVILEGKEVKRSAKGQRERISAKPVNRQTSATKKPKEEK